MNFFPYTIRNLMTPRSKIKVDVILNLIRLFTNNSWKYKVRVTSSSVITLTIYRVVRVFTFYTFVGTYACHPCSPLSGGVLSIEGGRRGLSLSLMLMKPTCLCLKIHRLLCPITFCRSGWRSSQ